MYKLFDSVVDYLLVLPAANEEFPPAQALDSGTAENGQAEVRGWSAYEIWSSRIRLLPGVKSLFVSRG
jgi:hypothetical protein